MIKFLSQLDQNVIEIIAALNDAVMDSSPTAANLIDRASGFVLGASMIKMGPLVLLLFYAWFKHRSRPGHGVSADAALVVRSVLAIMTSIAAGRLLQQAMPMRLRPRFVQPDAFFANDNPLVMQEQDWSSMPSDHAALVAALVVATWWTSRRRGLLSAAWGVFYVCLPRVYFGLHYVSDILAGAALGVALTVFILRMPLPVAAWDWLRRLEARVPALVILGLFVLGWEIIELFETARRLAAAVGKTAGILSADLGR